MEIRREIIKMTKRVVIKVGSAVLTLQSGGLNEEAFTQLSLAVSNLLSRGVEVAVVTSGAVAAGMGKLGLTERPKSIPEKQAAAAAGQSSLMGRYEKVFAAHNLNVAQVLLTHEDLSSRHRYLNARNTLFTLLSYGVIPIINENDTVVVDEIKFGDNDNLSALVAGLIDADLLLIPLHRLRGRFCRQPRQPIPEKLHALLDAHHTRLLRLHRPLHRHLPRGRGVRPRAPDTRRELLHRLQALRGNVRRGAAPRRRGGPCPPDRLPAPWAHV